MNVRNNLRTMATLTIWPALVATMSGCVAGQAIRLQHAAGSGPAFTSAKPISVDAKDSREFVVSGKKEGSYLGHFRAGFGNPWDVNNAGRRALADQFKQDIAAELQAHGNKTVATGERQLRVDIVDWNFDTHQNGRVWYEIACSVADAQGTALAKVTIKDTKVIRGSFWTGPAGAFKREVPVIYSGIVKEILGKPEIQEALR